MPVLLNYLKAFIKLISTGKNYGVLKRALKNESPREILINLYFAVINFSKYKKTSQISILVQHAKLINERLHLKATIHSTIHLKKVQVYINKSKSYEVDVKPFTSANIYRKSNEYHLDCKLELISTGLNIVRINAEGEGKLHNFFFFKTYSHSLNENYTKYYKAIDRKYKSQYGKINLPSQFFTLIEYECKGKINIVPEENIDLNKNKLIRKRDCGFKRYSVNIEIQDELYKILYQIDSPYVIIQSQDSILGQYTFTSFYKSIENATESPILLYSDDDQIMGKTHINPHFKTNFNRTLIWSYNYVGKNFCIRTQELKEALISIKYEGDVIYALLLNIFHHHGHSILHIPEVLFHYYGSKRHPFDIKLNDQKIALNNFLSSNNIDAKITSGLTSYTQRVRFETTSDKKVSIIIPFKDQATILKKCVQSIIKHTTGNFEVRVGEAYKLGGGPFAALSDQRLKRGVKEYTDGLDEIMKLRPVSFKYTKDVDPNGKDYIGVIAQEVQDVAPYMTQKYDLRDDNDKSKGEYLSVDPNAFTYMLINAVKEQQYIIDNYKSELNAVKERVGDLIAQLEDLKSQLVVDANSNTQEQLITLTGSGAKLSQNEPNPFNGYTKINYSVPSNANSSFIKIFDSAGVTVKVVNVEGNGVLSIRAEDLPSGYYFYSLYVDDQLIDSKKMLFDK